MEDVFSVAYQQTDDELDLEYAFFGIFDGHGGKEAALFAKEHLMDNITKNQNFWSENDDLVLKSIREGFLKTQQDMWGDLENWSRTGSGLPSTAGTTASIAFVRRGKIFVGHVGDSGIVLGEQDDEYPDIWNAKPLTRDHKPECEIELARIEAAGGKVVNKSGVPRVVWNRPRPGHTGPVRRSTPIDEVPFLAVARALGDLWSYNSKNDTFVVSPEPDLHVYTIDISKHRCLVLGTDGAWNVLSAETAVSAVKIAEKNNEKHMLEPHAGHTWQNPSKRLVDVAVDKWRAYKLRADNTSVVVVMLDPPGPPRAQVLRRQRDLAKGNAIAAAKKPCNNTNAPPLPPKPTKSLSIISRFPNSTNRAEVKGTNLVDRDESSAAPKEALASSSRIVHDSTRHAPEKIRAPLTATPVRLTNKTEPTCTATVTKPNVQVNEVTSSDTENTSPATSSTSQPKQKPRKSISRELANLALDSPVANSSRSRRSSGPKSAGRPTLKPKRRGRSIQGLGRDDSDTENVEGGMVPAAKLAEVEKKCHDLTKQLKAMEEKVSHQTDSLTQEFRALRSNLLKEEKGEKSKKAVQDGPETPRILRSRNENLGTPGSGTKRKLRGGENQVPPVKRERTVTWAGKTRPAMALPGAVKDLRGGGRSRTRNSTGGLTTTPLGKLRRAKITLKQRK